MILGLGTDIIEIDRIALAIKRKGSSFLDRIFTKLEQEYCLKHSLSARNFAGRFAAKEAIAKAIGKGIGSTLNWLDIEILNDPTGKPEVRLYLPEYERTEILVSISHCKTFATATAIWIK